MGSLSALGCAGEPQAAPSQAAGGPDNQQRRRSFPRCTARYPALLLCSQTSHEMLQSLVLIHTGSSNFINQIYFTEQFLHNHNWYKQRSKERVKVISWRLGEEVIHSLMINHQFPTHQGPALHSIRLYETCRGYVCREHSNSFNYGSFD